MCRPGATGFLPNSAASQHENDARIADLEATVVDLRATIALLADRSTVTLAEGHEPPGAAEPVTSSRRGLLKLAGAPAIGAVGVSVASLLPAAANNGISPTDTSAQTTAVYTATSSSGNGLLFAAGNPGPNTTTSTSPAALAGWATPGTSLKNGIYGSTNFADGAGVVAENNAIAGTGLKAISNAGIGGLFSGNVAVAANGTGAGVQATGPYRAYITGNPKANMFLFPGSTGTPKVAPPSRTDAHVAGELDAVGADLWFCTASGLTRARSDRSTRQGRLAHDLGRELLQRNDLRPGDRQHRAGRRHGDRRERHSGEHRHRRLPLGDPLGDTVVHAAMINRYEGGQILNNGVTRRLGGDHQLTVAAGGSQGAQTDFVIDVTGYFN